MDASQARFPSTHTLLALASAAMLATAACAAPAAAPTAAPPPPAPTVAPAKPAPTTAPAKPVATTAPAKPAATTAPAAKPTEKPAAKAEAKPAYDEKAVADFYRGKTIRIVVGFVPGGSTDVNARLLQQVLPRYVPGNPTIVVENKPGGGGLLAANTVYNSEPKDGTVIASIANGLELQQALGAPGVQFDAGKYQWLGSTFRTAGGCAVRTDAGIASVQDIMGQGGKELTVASFGKGTISYTPPAVMNAALGTRFKIVTGYEGEAQQTLAVRNKEVQGWCLGFQSILGGTTRNMFESSNPQARLLISLGPVPPQSIPSDTVPMVQGVPTAEALAKTDEARALIRAARSSEPIGLPFAVAPGVPSDRVAALRRAFDRTYADPEFIAASTEKVQRVPMPNTGEEVQRIVQETLALPPAALTRLKEILE